MDLFYHFVTFVPGVTLLIYMVITYFSYKSSYFGLFMLTYLGAGVLAFCFLTHSLNQQLGVTSGSVITHLEIASISLVVWSATSCIAKIAFNNTKLILKVSIGLLAFLPIGSYSLLLTGILKSQLIIDGLYLYLYTVLILDCVLVGIRLNKINNNRYRKFVGIFVSMLFIALMVFLAQAFIDGFVFNLFPLFYLIITIFLIQFSWKHIINDRIAKVFNAQNSFIEKNNITEKEQEIIKLVMKGYTNNSISKQLFISERTVDNHLYNIYKKLNISSRFELICLFKQ
mgnify:CR=1 FL=1